MEYFVSLRCDKPKIHTTLEEQASISFDWLNSRVATLYMLAQVVVNGEVLLKWFNVFGRETPTCTEIKARFNVASPILIYCRSRSLSSMTLSRFCRAKRSRTKRHAIHESQQIANMF